LKFTRFTKYLNPKYKKSLPAVLSTPTAKLILSSSVLIFSLLLLIAFISHLFNWKIDQDQVHTIIPDEPIQNSSGGFGAYFANTLMDKGFGLMAFTIPIIGIFHGLKSLLSFITYSYKELFKATFLCILWGSTGLSLLLPEAQLSLGGAFGKFNAAQLHIVFGNIGAWLILILTCFIYLIVYYDINPLEWIKKETVENDTNPIDKEIINETKKLDEDGFELIDTTDKIEAIKKEASKTESNEINLSLELDDNTIENSNKTNDSSDLSSPNSPAQVETLEPVATNNNNEIHENIDNAHELEIEQTQDEEIVQTKKSISKEYDPTLDLSGYKFPKLDFLEDHGSGSGEVDPAELEKNKNQIVQTLENYKIKIDKIKATIGPTVTLYEIVPAPGIRITKIKNLEDDIALSLAALGIRIIAPMPGKGTIGIEVPNKNPEVVAMKTVLGSDKFVNAKMDLPLALGKTISNEIFVTDLAKMPHLLIAGATGQGKSVGINAILVSLIYKKHPSQLKFVMVDPKKVELSIYRTIEKHFLAKLPNEEEPIITDTKKVINTLNSLCIEMDNRYELLKTAACRNLKEYNAKFEARKLNPQNGHKFLPYIVLVIDEFADLIMTAGKEVETPIARLAQLARAIGIHLIIATQRPSVNIITGMIKANFPARLAFRVMQTVDSRTILDATGANQLIGRGDMLISLGSDITRLQCPFVDTPEVDTIVNFIGDQRGYPSAFELPEYVGEDDAGGGTEFDASSRDSLFDDAARIVVGMQSGSTSMLQRRLKLGYNRAGRLMDELEGAGIVGAQQGSKPREVLVSSEMELEHILEQLNG